MNTAEKILESLWNVMKPFREQACTLSRNGSAVVIQCDDLDDAIRLYDFLELRTDTKPEPVE